MVWPWKLVRRRAMPPGRSTVQMLLAYAKAICVALTGGIRRSFVGVPLAAGRPANATAISVPAAHPASSILLFLLMAILPDGRAMVPSFTDMKTGRLTVRRVLAWLAGL